ncbi:MAG: hypothetical protein JF616_09210 [Fibrobacteres bacterium]|jgi:hypothetical protein|nr:hypothetical protein [Fibrobacterota bacterium]
MKRPFGQSLLIATLATLSATAAWAVRGPVYLSGRALGMGGAFVGLSDDYSGIYYNPAGLARLNTPLDAGIALKFDVGDLFGVAGDALNVAGAHSGSFASVDSMAADNTLVDDIMIFDRRPITLGTAPEMHFAARSTDPDLPLGIGAAWFLGSQGRFMLDKGIYIPAATARIRTDFVAKVAGAIQPLPGLSIGLSPTVATYHIFEQSISIQNYATAGDTLQNMLDAEKERIYKPGFGFGLTAGALYDIVPTELRVGAVVYNVFLNIDNDPVPITYSFGLAYLPAVLRNQGLLRYVNFDLDIEDAFAKKDFLQKVDFGAEMNMSLAQIRGGFKGGYPCYGLTANLFILQLEFTSWADEAGLYVGQLEDRHYMFGIRMGI